MYEVLCVTKAMFLLYSFPLFFFFWNICVVGVVATATLTLPARVVNGSESPRSLFICFNQYCYCSSVSAFSGRCCSFNMRKRARLSCVSFTFCLSHVTWPCWLHAFVSNAEQTWGRFLKWSGPRDSTWGRRLVFMFTKQVSVVDHPIIKTLSAAASCLPSCTAIRLVFNKLQTRMLLKWWRRNWLSPYGFSIFVTQSSIEALFCFPLAELELFMASVKMTKQNMRAC